MNKLKNVILLALLFMISACGGGGGEDNPTTPENNTPPTVDAGTAQTVSEGSTVQLSGSGNDIDGSVSYLWQQISGTTVVLSDTTISNPTFVAHQVTNTEELAFRLTVTDNDGSSVVDTISITINSNNTAGTTDTFLFYTHSLSAVDPSNPASPIQIEATENLITDLLFGFTLLPTQREGFVRSALYNSTKKTLTDLHTYAVIYPKIDGRLYKASALKSSSQTPVQVSNENLAQQMCDMADGGVKSDFANVENSQYVYRLSGVDELCDTTDDIWNMVTIGMDSDQSPILAKPPIIDIGDTDTGALTAWLVNDNNALQRCDANFTNCSFIREVTDYVNYKLKMADQFYLLEIDNQLFSYDISSNTLSSAIFTIANGTYITVAASDANMTYFGHGNTLYQFPVDGSTTATILTSEANEIQIVTPSTSNVIYQIGINGLGKEVKSIPKAGGAAINLAVASGDDNITITGVSNTHIYYNISNISGTQTGVNITPILAGVINETGGNKVEKLTSAWIGAAWNTNFDSSTTNSYGNAKTVFLAEGFNIANTAGGFAGAKVTSIDAVSAAEGAVLGTFETSDDLQNIYCLGFGPSLLCNASHAIDPPPVLPKLPVQTDIYFLNAMTPNSLMRVTRSENENELIIP